MLNLDFDAKMFSADTDEQKSAFGFLFKLPKGKKKRKKVWKRAQRDRDQLLMQLGRKRRENELLRDVIRISTEAADRHMDTRTAQTGLALSKRKAKKGGERR